MQDANTTGTLADDIVAGLPPFAPPITTHATDAPLPLPTIPDHDRLPNAVYALARIDASGRIADHTTPTALGWHPGDQLTTEILGSTTLVVHRQASGRTSVTTKRHVVIPASLRHHCGIRPGDRPATALPGRHTADHPPLRPPVEPGGQSPSLGRRPRHHHPLAASHHAHLVERHYGYAVAHTYAGHHDRSDSATPTYLHADTYDLAVAALSAS